MKAISPLSILLITAFTIAAQSQPDRWRGLIIEESTSADAIKILGQPNEDKKSVPGGTLIIKWQSKKRAADGRMFQYKKIEGFKDVKLFFDKDDKLVTIMLEPKKDLTPQELLASYPELDFRTGNEVVSPSDLDRPRDNLQVPTKFAVWYVLVGANQKVIVSAGIGNAVGNVTSSLFGNIPDRQGGRTYPGEVKIISLSSRALVAPQGADILK